MEFPVIVVRKFSAAIQALRAGVSGANLINAAVTTAASVSQDAGLAPAARLLIVAIGEDASTDEAEMAAVAGVVGFAMTLGDRRPRVAVVCYGEAGHGKHSEVIAHLADEIEIINITDSDIRSGEHHRKLQSLMASAQSVPDTNVGLPPQDADLQLSHMTLDSAPEAVVWINSEGRICYVNDVMCKRLQYSREELLTMSVSDINPDVESTAKFVNTFWPKLKQGGELLLEMRHQRKDGHTFPVEIVAHYIQDQSREFSCAFVRDISARRRQEEQQIMLSAAVRDAQDAIAIGRVERRGESSEALDGSSLPDARAGGEIWYESDTCVKLAFVNQTWKKLTGYRWKDVADGPMLALNGPESDPNSVESLRRAMHAGLDARVEMKVYRKDGSSWWADVNLTPIADRRSEITHWLLVHRDISDERQAIVRMSELAEAHRSMVKLLGTSDGVWEFRPQDSRMEFQPGYRKILGYEGDDRSAFPDTIDAWASRIHPDDVQRVISARQTSLETHLPFEAEYRMKHRSGTYVWLHDRGSAVYDESGSPVRMAGSIYDISTRKQAQAQILQQQKRLKRSNLDLAQFAYVASHDLKEPLRAVAGFVGILNSEYGDLLDEKGRRYIGKTIEGAKRMQGLIDDLLRYSQISNDEVSATRIPLRKPVENAISHLEQKIKRCRATVEIVNLPEINGDEAQLTQLFQNLIDNGLTYRSSERPHISISARELASDWEIAVADNGIGIPSEYREQIFSIFKRLHRREEYPGTGIGLAICRRVAERHGGSIRVDAPEEEGGSRFVVTLPRHDSPGAGPEHTEL